MSEYWWRDSQETVLFELDDITREAGYEGEEEYEPYGPLEEDQWRYIHEGYYPSGDTDADPCP